MARFLYIIFLFVFSLVNHTTHAVSVEVTSIKITKAGLFSFEKSKEEKNDNIATSKLLISKSEAFIKKTDKIYAKKGVTSFGISYFVNGYPIGKTVPIKVKWLHPPIYNSSTRESSSTTFWTSKNKIGKTNYVVHSYENAGDMPPGKYIIQLYYENRKLAEKEFLVVESP